MSATADPEGTIASGTADLHDLSVAHAELGNLAEAAKYARAGLKTGDRARFQLLLAWIELDRGATAKSLRHLDAAMPALSGKDLARARCLRGLHLCQSAEPTLAIAELSAAARELRRFQDHRWHTNALIGRGIARGYALRLADADADFSDARALLRGIGEHARAAMCLHNKGFVAMLAGRLPTALAHYERAAREGLDSTRHPEALIDRAEALLAAGLTKDARRVLTPALTLLRERGSRLPEALLLAGHCALRDGDHREARRAADHAARLFQRQHRHSWVPAARALSLRARGKPRKDEAERVAAQCRPVDAAELRFAAGLLEPVAAQRSKGTAHLRAMGWLARAHLARNRRAALAACRAGIAVLDEHRAAMGATELQVSPTWPGTELTELALSLAVRPRAVLQWAERHRASRLAHPPLLPPDDPELAVALSELRRARVHGEPLEVAERQVRRLALSRAHGEPSTTGLRVPDLAEALGHRAFVSFTVHNGQLLAVTLAHGRTTVRRLDEPVEQVHTLRLALTAGHSEAAARLAAGLDHLLLAGLPGEVVVAPDGVLHRMPWSALGRTVSVVPSAQHWLRANASAKGSGRVWIAGPGLGHAEQEVTALHRKYGGGRASTVDSVLSALDGAAVAHIAAHGHFRPEQPLFSHLQLSDGPLYGYDLERLRRAPEIVVLSACDSGLAPVLLDRGTRAVIASVLPVPDDLVAQLMWTLHDDLRNGPAQAVRRAQDRHGDLGFTCFGAG